MPQLASQTAHQKIVKALAHPLRVQILTILNQRVASPNELSFELDAGLSLISYHVKVLREHGCIDLVETKQRRGATEHFYRATVRPYLSDDDWRRLPPSARDGISHALLGMMVEDATAALEAGSFDEFDDSHMSRTPMVVDRQGWDDVTTLLKDTLDRILEIQADSANRLAAAGEEGFSTKVEIMHFKSPPA